MSTIESTAERPYPRKRASLTIRPSATPGRYVVKDSVSNAFFQIGEEEHFLLSQFEGPTSKATIRREFIRRFGSPISSTDLSDFIENGLKYGLLDEAGNAPAQPQAPPRFKGSSALYFRYRLFDPDWMLTKLEPWIRFIWTVEFVVASLSLIAFAMIVAIANRGEWISMFPDKLGWETAVLTFLFILLATLVHEFAHGLTCKHFGGKVHEIGVLMILFMPCMYCNVSDAWLFQERWKRMAVGIAGTYVDILIWALMTIVWRVTDQDSFVNYAAWLLSSVCLARTFFNLTPLLRLDGYYVLADWLHLPNLSIDGPKRWAKTVNWLLWGAPRPEPIPKGNSLLIWGAANWFFMCSFLYAILFSFFKIDAGKLTSLKTVFSAYAGYMIGKSVLKVFFSREIITMIRTRPVRTAVWGAMLSASAMALMVPVPDRVTGTFSVRPATHIEVVASESGFLEQIQREEGELVEAGAPLALVRIPSLETDIAATEAMVREAEAEWKRLLVGARPEEIERQQSRVAQAADWLERARRQFALAELSHQQQLVRLDHRIQRAELVAQQMRVTANYSEQLAAQQAIAGQLQSKYNADASIAALEAARCKSVKAQQQASGTIKFEAEVERRAHALADEQAELRLLELGSRAEDIEAQQARVQQLQQQLDLFRQTRFRLAIVAPVKGWITTSHLKDRNGKFVQQGEVICLIEELKNAYAEVAIPERLQRRIEVGQPIELRPRTMPDRSIHSTVIRKSPSVNTESTTGKSSVTVYCRLTSQEAAMISGMTGKARIYLDSKSIGAILADRIVGYVGTQLYQW